ncbi:hypothetical protein BpHYR1_016019 [Brachionus plicatilis]|uniref:Uncharacterized protein n=1 Tax=Brachionus plicatilis TaxID=10195 RepID=A0A3M7P9P8_BRAPC|nr:hypothetical protein BpHYR1_016019 [Brachionus plicatilis]
MNSTLQFIERMDIGLGNRSDYETGLNYCVRTQSTVHEKIAHKIIFLFLFRIRIRLVLNRRAI